MKKCSAHIVLLALALCYVLSTMGYGVHHCDHDGTSNVVLCYGESPCKHCHNHSECKGVCCKCSSCESSACHSSELCNCNSHNHVSEAQSAEKQEEYFGEYHHSSKCCHTSIFRVSDEQVLQDVAQCPQVGVYLLAYLPETPCMNAAFSSFNFIREQIPAPPLIFGIALNVINSQFLI